MGSCSCGQELLSPQQFASRLNPPVSPSRIWRILAKRPWRMRAFRIGETWAIPVQALQTFARNPVGVHLREDDIKKRRSPLCPGCGERLYSSQQAAGPLSTSAGRVRAILSKRPERLQAFQIGSRWIIPQRGIDSFQRQRQEIGEAQKRVVDIVAGQARWWTTQELAEEATRRGRPISLRKVQRLCKSGEIVAKRPGRDYVIPDAAAKLWLEGWVGRGEEEVSEDATPKGNTQEAVPAGG